MILFPKEKGSLFLDDLVYRILWVLENLESPGILLWHFPGLEHPGKRKPV